MPFDPNEKEELSIEEQTVEILEIIEDEPDLISDENDDSCVYYTE